MLGPAFVGIDVSKARLDVYVHPAGDAFAVANNPAVLYVKVTVGPNDDVAAVGRPEVSRLTVTDCPEEFASDARRPLVSNVQTSPFGKVTT